MTPQALALLKRLIEEDRAWRTRRDKGELVHPDDRGIEVSRVISGIDPRTAHQLVKHGLAEIVNVRGTQNYIFLGKYEPFDSPPQCEHDWPEKDGQTDENGYCTKCGESFQFHIHG